MRKATAEVLDSMLKENTGRHFLDSGGAYGRRWERNQGKDFEKVQPTTLEVQVRTYDGKMCVEFDITHNLYHWLKERVDADEQGQRAMRVCSRFIRASNWRDGNRDSEYDGNGKWSEHNGELPSDFELAHAFPYFFAVYKARRNEADREECGLCDGDGEHYHLDNEDDPDKYPCITCGGKGYELTTKLRWDQKKGFIHESPYELGSPWSGDGPVTTYTYNEENLLSQNIHFDAFSLDNEEYIVLQVHGGCDARGGFTDPKVFTGNGNSEWAIFDYGKATLYCTNDGKQKPNPTLLLPGFKAESRVDPTEIHCWSADGGYRGFSGHNYEAELDTLPLVIVDATEYKRLRDADEDEDKADMYEDDDGAVYSEKWIPGKLCVDNEKKSAMCPHCGGTLVASSY